MSIYYEDEYVQLHHGDCRAIRGWTTADVLVTDPPYGMGYVESRSSTRGNKLAPIAGDAGVETRDEILRIWGDRPALVFGTWRAVRPLQTRQLLVWDKGDSPGMGDLAMPWGPAHEEVYVLGEGWAGKRRPNVYRAKTYGAGALERPDHPTPKPVGLMEALIEYCPAGVIADPFAGSGATLIAARNLGRKAIGVELEEKYCELIVKRLSQQAFDFSSLEAS